jgi:hypothetical protein
VGRKSTVITTEFFKTFSPDSIMSGFVVGNEEPIFEEFTRKTLTNRETGGGSCIIGRIRLIDLDASETDEYIPAEVDSIRFNVCLGVNQADSVSKRVALDL